jgi:branched-chain amino acid transport system permease protein
MITIVIRSLVTQPRRGGHPDEVKKPPTTLLYSPAIRSAGGSDQGEVRQHVLRRLARAFAILAIGFIGSLLVAQAVGAQTPANESVNGKVFDERLVDGKTVHDPLPGVKVSVTTPDGGAVGEATTDADGSYHIDLPAPGAYVLTLDKDTLPKGVKLTNAADATRAVNVRPDQTLIGNFFVGTDTRKQDSRLSLLPQTIADGLLFGLIIAVCSVGLSMIYGVTGLANFAHGEIVTFGALVTYWVNVKADVTLLAAAPVGIAAAGASGFVFERGLWRPLRRKGTSLTSMMIVSIGVSILLRFFWQYVYGGRLHAYAQYATQPRKHLGLFDMTPRGLTIIGLCLVILVGLALFLLRTRLGKAIRAVSDNADLASSTGINTDRVILLVWVVGSALAGLGGTMFALDQQLKWDTGFSLLLLIFAAITLGGLGSAFGALAGSLVIGLTIQMWGWVFPSMVELQRVGALIALILLLLVRPQGLLGRRERIG